jgi:hypothetical protein
MIAKLFAVILEAVGSILSKVLHEPWQTSALDNERSPWKVCANLVKKLQRWFNTKRCLSGRSLINATIRETTAGPTSVQSEPFHHHNQQPLISLAKGTEITDHQSERHFRSSRR